MSFDRGRVERQRDGIFAGLGQRFKDYAPSPSLGPTIEAIVDRRVRCQIAFNCDPPFAFNSDPASVRDAGAETGGAEPHIAEQSRSWRAASGEREVMRGS